MATDHPPAGVPGDVYDALRGVADEEPAAPFLLFADDGAAPLEISYAEQVRRADETRGLLATAGVRTGSRVHLMTPNRPEFIDVWFACARLGAVAVPVNPLSTADEVAHQLADSRAELSVVEERLRSTVEPVAGDRTVLTLDELVERRRGATPPGAPARPETAAIMFTSGTTAAPKGVRITHANYLRAGRMVADHLAMTADDRWLVTLPLFHGNAQFYCLMSALVTGGSVAVASRFSATGWPGQLHTLRPTLASLFAAPIRMVLARSEPAPSDADNVLRIVLFAQNLAETQAVRGAVRRAAGAAVRHDRDRGAAAGESARRPSALGLDRRPAAPACRSGWPIPTVGRCPPARRVSCRSPDGPAWR